MAYLDFDGLSTYDGLIKAEISGKIDVGGRTGGIPYGNVDSTSTAKVFTATVDGLTELYDGACVMLRNGVITSASGWTLNVNNLGALPVYSNMGAQTRETTLFNTNYTMLFVYDSDRVEGGCWVLYRGYYSDADKMAYQVRTNNTVRNVSDTARYYKIYFTSADGTMWVPASVNSTNNASAARPVNQRPIDPFGPIVYTSANTSYAAGDNLAAGTMWQQYNLTLGYSFNRTGAALTLTPELPVYVKCAPQANGSAIMDANEPIVQALPASKDGKIYIYLGLANSATACELQVWHPVYWHDGTGIRIWTGSESGSSIDPATAAPSMDGTAAAGTSTDYARADHVHPTDTSRAAASHTHAIADVTGLQSALDGKQGTLVSGTNIKTVNGTSLLGSGNISTAELPAVTAADNGKVLMVVGGVWQVASLPIASDSAFGVVKVDGTTITATDGVISTAGGAETHEVTITLTNPSYGQYFNRCDISGYNTTAEETTVLLGEIDSPTGSTTIEYDPSLHEKLGVSFSTNWGTSYNTSDITCTGGVSYYDKDIMGVCIFNVEGDGTITIDGIDYGD